MHVSAIILIYAHSALNIINIARSAHIYVLNFAYSAPCTIYKYAQTTLLDFHIFHIFLGVENLKFMKDQKSENLEKKLNKI